MTTYMQEDSRTLIDMLRYAASYHADVEVITRAVEDGSLRRSSYGEVYRRTCQLANALAALGLGFQDRVGTMAWNTDRHLEAWYAVAGQGAICHTVNPRLYADQIEYIIRHAGDRFLMVDLDILPVVQGIADRLECVEVLIVMTSAEHMPAQLDVPQQVYCYEELVAGHGAEMNWPGFPQDTLSSLCYTSGTTGNPKGVAYTHASNLAHAISAAQPDSMNLSTAQSVLMVVPMFHANSWGIAYSAPMTGSRLVLPGSRLDGASIWELLEGERVSFSAAVPTVWNLLLAYLKETGRELPYLSEVVIGGSAVPRSMMEVFDRDYGVTVIHAWGMTEMSPLGSVCRLTPAMTEWDAEKQLQQRLKQGRPPFGVEMQIVDDHGNELPHDGEAFGRLLVRGPWVVERYYLADEPAVDEQGWFDTGDVATIDEYGFMKITDRAKDVIKSGGEWISSVDLENAAMAHPDVDLAAVIGMPHPKWEERPLLIVKLKPGRESGKAEIIDFLADKVARWWLPDEVVFVEDIPLTATGKLNKLALRQRHLD